MSLMDAMARHESAHAARSYVLGFPIRRVAIDCLEGGTCESVFPFDLFGIRQAYGCDPRAAAQTFQHILSVYMAGHLATPSTCPHADKSSITLWCTQWRRASGSAQPYGLELARRAEDDVWQWLREARVERAIVALTRELLAHKTLVGSVCAAYARIHLGPPGRCPPPSTPQHVRPHHDTPEPGVDTPDWRLGGVPFAWKKEPRYGPQSRFP